MISGIYAKQYMQKLRTPAEAAMLVRNGYWVDYGQSCSFPEAFDYALAERRDELRDVKIRSAVALKPVQVVEKDPEMQSFIYNVWHCSSIDRKYLDMGSAFCSPMLFRYYGSYYKKGYCKVDVAVVMVGPIDEEGYFSFGLTNGTIKDILDSAKYIIVEVCDEMPKISGLKDDKIHISKVEYIVEGHSGLSLVKPGAITDIDRKIAENIFPYLYDGITLQLGIGGLPSSLGMLIADSDLKNLGMHTEMLSDGYLKLLQSGKINNIEKPVHTGKSLFSVCFGSRELYNYIDGNSDILSAPTDYINKPELIRELDHFVSINGCIACDLYGQVDSESVGTRMISGTGGQVDFIIGAYEAEHGQAFLTMASARTDNEGNLHSNIIPRFTGGDIITTPRTVAPVLVTEYGTANLIGKTTWERAEAIINIAHPDFRDELIAAAEAQKIWRNSNRR